MSAPVSDTRAIRHELRPTGTAAGEARRLVAELPELARAPDLRFAAQLLTSELVANSIRHAGLAPAETVALAIDASDAAVRVEVADGGPGFDPLTLLVAHHESGEPHHGIMLVDALSDRWGFRWDAEGFCVWFELDLVPGRRSWRGRERVGGPGERA